MSHKVKVFQKDNQGRYWAFGSVLRIFLTILSSLLWSMFCFEMKAHNLAYNILLKYWMRISSLSIPMLFKPKIRVLSAKKELLCLSIILHTIWYFFKFFFRYCLQRLCTLIQFFKKMLITFFQRYKSLFHSRFLSNVGAS